MIANTMPYYISPYGYCNCSWTMCQCRSYQQQQTFWITVEPKLKPETNKSRMDRLRFRVKSRAEPKNRYRAPMVRPSIQQLSMRIR